MREIKFRGYNFTKNKMIGFEKIRPLDYVYDGTLDEMVYGMENHLKLMQYTGLKDKNDVEIYEGDIIEYMAGQLKHIPTKHKVIWDSDEARFSFGCKANKQYMFYNTVVIGNIYENPELLEIMGN